MGSRKSKFIEPDELSYQPENSNGFDNGPYPSTNDPSLMRPNLMPMNAMNAPLSNVPNPTNMTSMNAPFLPGNFNPANPLPINGMNGPMNVDLSTSKISNPTGMVHNGLNSYAPYCYSTYGGKPFMPPMNNFNIPAPLSVYPYSHNQPAGFYSTYKSQPITTDFLPVSLLTGISQGQVANLYHEFLSVTGGQQMLDFSTFRTLFLSALCGVDCNYLNSLAMDAFKTFDSNRDGAIDFVEFVNAFKLLQHSNYGERTYPKQQQPPMFHGMIPQTMIT